MSAPHRAPSRTARLTLVAMLPLLAGRASAHEIGKTQVTVVFGPDRTYQVDVLVDPESLLTKLEALSGGIPLEVASPAARARRIEQLQETWLSQTTVMFDDVRVRPGFSFFESGETSSADPNTPLALVRLSGEVPRGAKQFRWGYALTFGSYALTVRTSDSGRQVTEWLAGKEVSRAFELHHPVAVASRASIAGRYLLLGFTHILPRGLDHILFVLGLFLLSTRLRSTLIQVTAFTVAHSITLGLTIYGVVSLPPSIVEPLIALSIAYVALENLFATEVRAWRVALVFGFGLLHGMGFAGVLRELGLPRSEFLTALLTFNLGVEAGQVVVIGLALLVLCRWQTNANAYRRWIASPASALIALIGLYWTVQRAFA